jgi:predicted nucleic acid-binding Zn ribbon protein
VKKTQSYFLVKDVLPGVFENISRRNIQDQISLEKRWQEIVGGDADKAVIVGSKDGCVFVNVDCSTRLFQMRVRKQRILSAIQEQHKDINNIVFKIGKVK